MAKQETGDRATYAQSRLMESELPKEETYEMAKENLGELGPSFTQEKEIVSSGFGRQGSKKNHKGRLNGAGGFRWVTAKHKRLPLGDFRL